MRVGARVPTGVSKDGGPRQKKSSDTETTEPRATLESSEETCKRRLITYMRSVTCLSGKWECDLLSNDIDALGWSKQTVKRSDATAPPAEHVTIT